MAADTSSLSPLLPNRHSSTAAHPIQGGLDAGS